MSSPSDRPTLSQLAAGSQEPAGVVCPRCHCRDFRVVNTWRRADGTIARQRRCRHCGQPINTVESLEL